MTGEQKLRNAREDMFIYTPYWGMMASGLEIKKSNKQKAGATDGKNFYFNENYVNSLSEEETTGFFASIAGHLAMKHHIRIGDRRLDLYNKAADYVLNPELIKAGFNLPGEPLMDSRFDGLSVEDVYNILLQEETQDSGGEEGPEAAQQAPPEENPPDESGDEGTDSEQQESTEPSDGDGTGNQDSSSEPDSEVSQDGQEGPPDAPESTNSENMGNSTQEEPDAVPDPGMCGAVMPAEDEEEQEAEWDEKNLQAYRFSRGDMPAGMQKQIEQILHPKIPWNIYLMDFCSLHARNDYNWNKQNKRFIHQDIIMPSLVSEALPEVVIYVDTSMSTWSFLDEFCAEVSGVLEHFDTLIHVIYCDAKFQGEEVYTRADLPLKLEPKGGGGTNFGPAFEYVEQQGYCPSCAIFLTDLDGRFPDREPDYPVLWIVRPNHWTKGQSAPFGETIEF